MLDRKRCMERILEELENGYDGLVNDLHNAAFNTDYEYIYYNDAKVDLEKYGVFDAIERVKEWEEENLGAVQTDFSDPCKVANMLFYIMGEEIISELDSVDGHYDELLDESVKEEIIKEIESKLEVEA